VTRDAIEKVQRCCPRLLPVRGIKGVPENLCMGLTAVKGVARHRGSEIKAGNESYKGTVSLL